MKTNIHTRKLVQSLEKTKLPIWKRVAKELLKPTRIMCRVNIDKLDKCVREDETAVVPGKVLSMGTLSKNTTVAAFQFSEKAKEKINAKGKTLSIEELLAKNPKGSKVRIIQ